MNHRRVLLNLVFGLALIFAFVAALISSYRAGQASIRDWRYVTPQYPGLRVLHGAVTITPEIGGDGMTVWQDDRIVGTWTEKDGAVFTILHRIQCNPQYPEVWATGNPQ